jgi:hypothetical protein
MFDDTKRLCELRRRITSLQGERAALLLIAAGESTMDRRSELVRDITHRTQMLEALERFSIAFSQSAIQHMSYATLF